MVRPPGIESASPRSAVKHSTDWAILLRLNTFILSNIKQRKQTNKQTKKWKMTHSNTNTNTNSSTRKITQLTNPWHKYRNDSISALLPISAPLEGVFVNKRPHSAKRPYSSNREFKQLGRRRLQKRRLKSDLALPQTLSRLYQLVKCAKCWQILLELNSKELYRSSGKEKESCCRPREDVKLFC